MNKTNFEHAGYAVLMQLPFGLLGYWWVGAAFGAAFFLGREHAQQQAKGKGDIEAFDVSTWSLDAQLDLLFPIIAVLLVCWVQYALR
jgi:hypothetical protein